MNSKKALFYVGLLWRPVLITSILITFASLFISFHLSSLLQGYSIGEISFFQTAKEPLLQSMRVSVFFPVFVIIKLLFAFSGQSIELLRYTSAFLGLATVILMFLLMRSWHTTRVALITSTLLLSSSWFLVSTRSATFEIFSVFVVVLLLLCRDWLLKTKKKKLAILTTAACLGLTLYVPAGGIFLVGGLIWQHKKIINELRSVPFWTAVLSLIIFLGVAIFGILQFRNSMYIRWILVIPPGLPHIKDVGYNFLRLIGGIFWNSNLIPITNIFANPRVGAQSLLDIFSITMLIAGIYTSFKRRALDRHRLIILALPILLIILSLGGVQSSIILVPFVYIAIGNGIAWTLQQWFAVFPKNPVAKNFGLILMISAVLLSCTYNSYRYFVAWPHMETTILTYNRQP